jgi:hypothetical protein
VRAPAKAAALAKRSAGSFSNAVSTASSTVVGTRGRARRMAVGCSVRILATMAWAVLPVNGGSPVSISYVITPSAYTSLGGPISRSPMACSGLMYCGVPRLMPVSVMRAAFSLRLTARAIPKSATRALPSCSSTFSGLMSR